MSSRFQSVEKKLPVKLDDSQLATVGEELGEYIDERRKKKEEAKGTAKGYKEDIDALDVHIEELGQILRTKAREQKVVCAIEADLTKFEIVTKRQDTGEIVDVRPMDPDERQLHLNLDQEGFHGEETQTPSGGSDDE